MITKASDFEYEEVKEFKDWNELMEYLKEKYPSWILELEPERIIHNWFASKENEKVDVEALMYDDYVE